MIKKPFLTIVTRCCMRPESLSANIESVKAQTCQDIEQIFIVDRKKKGIQNADKSFRLNTGRVFGRYVYILDDDCKLINPQFVKALKRISKCDSPDIIMVKSLRPPGPPSYQAQVPVASVWEGKPTHGTTNCLCYVIKREIWQRRIYHYGRKPWGGDWWFLEALLQDGCEPRWLDMIVADACQLGRGKLFEEVEEDWFDALVPKYGLEYFGHDDYRLRLYLEKEKEKKKENLDCRKRQTRTVRTKWQV